MTETCHMKNSSFLHAKLLIGNFIEAVGF